MTVIVFLSLSGGHARKPLAHTLDSQCFVIPDTCGHSDSPTDKP